MTISGVVAMSSNGVIGRGGRLPWHIPNDLRRFKKLTLGHRLVMGRKTYESIGRPLPGRTSFVVTRQRGSEVPPGVVVTHSLTEALHRCEGEKEAFVIGGGQIYREALDHMDRLYVTLVHTNLEGDVRFPPLDWGNWRLVKDEHHDADEGNPFDYSFQLHERIWETSAAPQHGT